MSVYPERRKGKLTGVWIAEAMLKGSRVRKRCGTKAEGERWADTITLTGTAPVEAGAVKGVTFGDMAQACKDAGGPDGAWKRERDPSVLQRLDEVIRIIGQDTLIAEVTTRSLDTVVADLSRRPGSKAGTRMSSATVNRYLTAASCVLTFAETRGHIARAPKVPWQTEVSERWHWLTEDVEDAVCAHMQAQGLPYSALTVRVLVATGMRWGEYEALEAAQVEDEWVRLWKTKTDTPRSIPIAQQLAGELRAMVGAGKLPGYYTFRRHLKAALESAGQPPEVSIHSLRHTTASRLVLAKEPLPVVQRYLGHKNIQTTMRYVHVADDHLVTASKNFSPRAGRTDETTTFSTPTPNSVAQVESPEIVVS